MEHPGADSRSRGQENSDLNETKTVNTLFKKAPLDPVPYYFNPVHNTNLFFCYQS